MKEQSESKESLKLTIKLARASGLLTSAKSMLELGDVEINRDGFIKLIEEVLELLK